MAVSLTHIAAALALLTAAACGQELEEVVIHPQLHIDSLNITNKEQIDCGYIAAREPFVIFAAGQSLVANANGDYPWLKVTPQNVYEEWGTLCYKANAPLYGASDSRQSFVLPLADLVARGTGRDVVIVMAAIGGTPIESFIDGVGARLVTTQIGNAATGGLKPSVVLWQHGQSNRLSDAETYANQVDTVVSIFRDSGVSAPIFVATDSMFEWETFGNITEAQDSIQLIEGVFPGPNIDLIRFRLDGTHLDETGMQVQAAMWFQVLADHFQW